ncbi:MAG: S8 family serine peptidase [Proteobacteria bacterium]|nr:S8 family serine peptidase [Pseudomonadota bacterium]
MYSIGILRRLVATALFSGAFVANAATVAIIDSGVDYKHEALAAKMWTNPNSSTTDDAGNTYKNDTNGWNFAENNNQIIDYKYVGTFSPDCFRMIEVQGRILQGIATPEEQTWYKSKRADANFLKEMQKFGNFIHGTHVSGISTDQSQAADVVGVKLIPTETPGAGLTISSDRAANPMVSALLGMVAKRQASLLLKAGKYTKAVGARVANGSFGTSVAAVKPVVAQLVKQITGADPTEAELNEYALDLVQKILKESQGFVAASPGTLFVFAAGNDGTNNDQSPVSPANIKTDNTIAVAATLGAEKIATFSNFGTKMVDVAAPGVAIRASIPGNQYLPLSGTSMAAPFVTNVAARVQEANEALKPVDIKRILVDTVDKKDWLTSKVRSGGIVNAERAVEAASLSRSMSVEQAIKLSRSSVGDEMHLPMNIDPKMESELLVTSLPSLFQ